MEISESNPQQPVEKDTSLRADDLGGREVEYESSQDSADTSNTQSEAAQFLSQSDDLKAGHSMPSPLPASNQAVDNDVVQGPASSPESNLHGQKAAMQKGKKSWMRRLGLK